MSTETGGLGNRLKSWVSAMRLDPQARVFWPVTPNMPAAFPRLFANDCWVESVPPAATEHKSWRLVVLPEDEPHLPAGFATAGGGAHPVVRAAGKAWWIVTGRKTDRYRYMPFPKQHSRRSSRRDGRHIDLEYERIPQHFRGVYVPLFRKIAMRPEILRAVEAFAAEHLDARVVGVQVRTWRDDARRRRKYHEPSRERLWGLMDACPGDARFLVVSDADEAVDALRERYGASRVLAFPRRVPRAESWRSAEGIAEDLIDLLLLARVQRLLASYLSTFSEAAWWLGGATASVDVF